MTRSPLLDAMRYTAKCLLEWERRGLPPSRFPEFAQMLMRLDGVGWTTAAMMTAWGL